MLTERDLRSGDLIVGKRIAGGVLEATVNGVGILVKDADNRKTFSARECIPGQTDLEREYATYLFAKRFPLADLPVQALRESNGTKYLAMEKITGVTQDPWRGKVRIPASVTVQRNLALFDALVGNTDRHGYNWFSNVKGRDPRHEGIVCIDHGLCWPNPTLNNGRVDLGTTNFTERYETLPKWARGWLTKIINQQAHVIKDLRPYIEYEAIEAMLVRAQWMLNNNSFMGSNKLALVHQR